MCHGEHSRLGKTQPWLRQEQQKAKGWEIHFSKQNTPMATKHATSLIIREMFLVSLFTIAKEWKHPDLCCSQERDKPSACTRTAILTPVTPRLSLEDPVLWGTSPSQKDRDGRYRVDEALRGESKSHRQPGGGAGAGGLGLHGDGVLVFPEEKSRGVVTTVAQSGVHSLLHQKTVKMVNFLGILPQQENLNKIHKILLHDSGTCHCLPAWAPGVPWVGLQGGSQWPRLPLLLRSMGFYHWLHTTREGLCLCCEPRVPGTGSPAAV